MKLCWAGDGALSSVTDWEQEWVLGGIFKFWGIWGVFVACKSFLYFVHYLFTLSHPEPFLRRIVHKTNKIP